MTLGSVLLTLALVGLLYLGSVTLALTRRLSAQLAVLTIRVTDLVESAEWRSVALRVGEDLSSVGPHGYYAFTAGQWREWALARLRETPAPPQEKETK